MAGIEPQQIAGRWVRPELIVEPSAVRVRVGIQVDEPGELLGDAIAVTLRAGAETLAAVSAPAPGVALPCASTGATYAWAEFVFANPRGLVPTAIALTLGEATATATFDLADVTPSAPPPPPPPPVSLSFPVLRPDDLVNLRVDTVNLALDTRDPQQPMLVHADPEQEALLIVRFAPQTIVEEAFFEGDGPEQKVDPGEGRDNAPTIATTPSAPGTLAARIGEETRLVFRVPSGASIRYSVAGILDWSRLELVVAPVADVAARRHAAGRRAGDPRAGTDGDHAAAALPPASVARQRRRLGPRRRRRRPRRSRRAVAHPPGDAHAGRRHPADRRAAHRRAAGDLVAGLHDRPAAVAR